MVIVVVIINLALALMFLFGAWVLRKLPRPVAGVANAIYKYENIIDKVLRGAPNAISKGQLGIKQLRHKQKQLEPQIQRVRLVLSLLGLGQQVWRRFVLAQRSR